MNIGSDEMVTHQRSRRHHHRHRRQAAAVEHIPGPLGVRGRNSDNALIREKLDWEPSEPLKRGLAKTYPWISEQIKRRHNRH